MRKGWLLGLALVGCNGGGGSTSDDTAAGSTTPNGQTANGGTVDCPIQGGALPDLFQELAGIDHACEDQPLYNPDVSTATSYFIGEFSIDDCGEVRGTETWVLFANPKWQEEGGYDCQVVWNVTGIADGSPTNYALTLAADVDLSQTDCPTDFQDTPLYVGDTSMNLEYKVNIDGDEATFSFKSGTYLGTGHANQGHASYLSEMNCKLL